MTSFLSGGRVCVDGLASTRCTVLGWPAGLAEECPDLMGKGYVPLCADLKDIRNADYFSKIDSYCGPGCGRLVKLARLKHLGEPCYHTISLGIGVCVPPDSGPLYKEVTTGPQAGKVVSLPSGLTGRVVRYKHGSNVYEISWHIQTLAKHGIHRNECPVFHSTIGVNGTDYASWESIERVRWCRMRPDNGNILKLWPSEFATEPKSPAFILGDYVLYRGGRPMAVAAGNGCRYIIMPGDIVQIVYMDSQRGTAHVRLPPWVGERYTSGCNFVVDMGNLRPLEHPLIQSGTEVTVVASIDFGGQSLEGRQGVVVIPTDSEGDIGIEFTEEVRGAGSLDGRGENGRCLYVPVSAVEAGGAE
jgi:hypothetical protein